MLGGKDAVATLPVSDLDRAREFYGNTLGLTAIQDTPEGIVYKSGNTVVFIYPSEYAGTNRATAAAWAVGDEFDVTVQALAAAGMTFEHYDLPETTLEGDVHVSSDYRAVWFKDPDGNVLNVVDMAM